MAATWNSGSASGPSAGQVIVDTGAFPSTLARYFIPIMNATLATTFKLQHVDTDGTTVLDEQEVSCLAGVAQPLPQVFIQTTTDQRVRVVMKSALTLGSVSCSLFWGSF